MSAGFGDQYLDGSGFGDPYPLSAGDLSGFGDPYDSPRAVVAPASQTLPHTGGAPLVLIGDFPTELAPYKLTMSVDGQTRELYSGRAGQGAHLHPLRGKLRSYTPPSPAGTYTLTLLYGPSFGQSLELTNALEVAPAPRLAERYALARLFPSLYATGPRDSQSQAIDPATETPTRGTLELVIETAAQLLTKHAAPATVTTAPTPPSAAPLIPVESVLGFAPTGRAWIDGQLRAYTLSGQALQLTDTTRRHIPEGAEVKAHVYRTT